MSTREGNSFVFPRDSNIQFRGKTILSRGNRRYVFYYIATKSKSKNIHTTIVFCDENNTK